MLTGGLLQRAGSTTALEHLLRRITGTPPVLVALLASVINVPVDADDVADSADLLVGGSLMRIGDSGFHPIFAAPRIRSSSPHEQRLTCFADPGVEIRPWSTSSG